MCRIIGDRISEPKRTLFRKHRWIFYPDLRTVIQMFQMSRFKHLESIRGMFGCQPEKSLIFCDHSIFLPSADFARLPVWS